MNTFHSQPVALCSWPDLTDVMEKESQPSESRSGYQEPEQGDSLCAFERIRTDSETGQTVVRYDHGSVPLTVAIPGLVAERAGVDPLSLPPLYDCIDADALERVATDRRPTACGVAVSFRYAGYTVAVDGERLSVTPLS